MKPLHGTKKKAGFSFAPKLLLLDKLTIAYMLFTALYIIVMTARLPGFAIHLWTRLLMFTGIYLTIKVYELWPNFITEFLRIFYPFIIMTYFYSETEFLNKAFPPNDAMIIHYEKALFGCLPSMTFSAAYPQEWFSAIMHFGYFSYYLIIAVVCIAVYYFARPHYEKVHFITLLCFFFFYIIFIFFPTYGPLFYFPHSMLQVPAGGFFKTLVNWAQDVGEGATAAFPSSHVGIVAILCYLSYRYHKPSFYMILIPSILICFATVYVKAHYLLDVFGGLIVSPIMLVIAYWAYDMSMKKQGSAYSEGK